MSEEPYTPTTEQVREAYSNDSAEEYHDPINYPSRVRQNRREFDRWFAAEIAKARAEQREADQAAVEAWVNNVFEAIGKIVSEPVAEQIADVIREAAAIREGEKTE